EMFARDRNRFAGVREGANACPLGSGAIAGTTLPIDRAFTAKELGFVDADGKPRLTHNSMDAVADRDPFLDFAHACGVCGVHLSRLSEDFILWNSAEFGFIKLPDAFTTGSSLMPQKKNPDSFELLRGKVARFSGNLQTVLMLCKGLPLTYNRDLQDDKPPVFDSFDQLEISLAVAAGSVAGAQINETRCAAAVADPNLLATDLVDYLVLRGVPFRDAHHVIGALVGLAEERGSALPELSDADVAKICDKLGPDWREVFDVSRALAARERPGMPGPKTTRERIDAWRACLGLI
ncbi:MAG: argininosuccinate lyase, partial [Opitutales bacterium]